MKIGSIFPSIFSFSRQQCLFFSSKTGTVTPFSGWDFDAELHEAEREVRQLHDARVCDGPARLHPQLWGSIFAGGQCDMCGCGRRGWLDPVLHNFFYATITFHKLTPVDELPELAHPHPHGSKPLCIGFDLASFLERKIHKK